MKLPMRLLLATACLPALLVGCKNDNQLEDAGEAVDEAIDDAGDEIEDAADDVEDAVDGNG